MGLVMVLTITNKRGMMMPPGRRPEKRRAAVLDAVESNHIRSGKTCKGVDYRARDYGF